GVLTPEIRRGRSGGRGDGSQGAQRSPGFSPRKSRSPIRATPTRCPLNEVRGSHPGNPIEADVIVWMGWALNEVRGSHPGNPLGLPGVLGQPDERSTKSGVLTPEILTPGRRSGS